MIVCKTLTADVRMALIARLVGDHRAAPNLWLARRIVQQLDEMDADAITPVQQPTAGPAATMRRDDGQNAQACSAGSGVDSPCGR